MFLDSDVELNSDYAITLINALEEDFSLLGAQGVDYFLQQSYINPVNLYLTIFLMLYLSF